MRQLALEIAEKAIGSNSSEYLSLQENIPSKGLFRAVVTAQREPLSHTIVRAPHRGAEVFWQKVGNAKTSNRSQTDRLWKPNRCWQEGQQPGHS